MKNMLDLGKNGEQVGGFEQETWGKISEIVADFPTVEKLVLFGSRAKGNYRPASDIDLWLVGKEVSLDDQLKIAGKLEDLWLPQQFDLIRAKTVDNQELKKHVERVGIVIWQKTVTKPKRSNSDSRSN